MVYLERIIKHNIIEKFLHYKRKLDSLNIFIKVIIKVNYKVFKFSIEILYN